MKDELLELRLGVFEYTQKVADYVKPAWAIICSVLSYVLFPDKAYVAPTIGLLGALVLDVLTKYYAISKNNGGFCSAIRTRKISSESMWKGTKKKLVSVLVVMICCGLLMRFTAFLPQIAITVTTISYMFMFLREVQSIVENLMDAGNDELSWFLKLIKRKKGQLLEDENVTLEDEDK